MIAVIDYEAGNLRSVETALRRLGSRFYITSQPDEVRNAERVIVPGVGEAAAAMDRLNRSGLAEAIREFAATGRPLMGICLGSQIVLDRSEENDASCLGLIPGAAREFDRRPGRKVPHMGWNTIRPVATHAILSAVDDETSFYFVHSYVPVPDEPGDCLAVCEYGETFCAVLGRDNVVATQFHPEKSGEAGIRMLDAFLQWTP